MAEAQSREPVKKSIAGESRSQKAGSDLAFAHFWDRIAVVYDAASYYLTGSLGRRTSPTVARSAEWDRGSLLIRCRW